MHLLPVDYEKSQVPDPNRFSNQAFPDDLYGTNVAKFDAFLGIAPHKKHVRPMAVETRDHSEILIEPPTGDGVTAMGNVSQVASAREMTSARQASLLNAGTMRGFTLAERRTPPRTEADYAALAAYGANLARIGVMLDVDAGLTTFSMSQLERDHMQTTVAMAEKFGFKVVITLTAGSFSSDKQVVWGNPSLQSSLASLWAGIAAQYKGNPGIGGYELLNEPKEPRHRTGQPFNPPGKDEWRP